MKQYEIVEMTKEDQNWIHTFLNSIQTREKSMEYNSKTNKRGF